MNCYSISTWASRGRVIHAKAAQAKHVNYRNSVLTGTLRETLEGDAKVLFLAHLDPANLGESPKSQVSNANGPNKSAVKGAPVDQVVEEAPPEEENEEGAEEEEKKEETPENDIPEDNMQLVVAEADYSPLALERERLERGFCKLDGRPLTRPAGCSIVKLLADR